MPFLAWRYGGRRSGSRLEQDLVNALRIGFHRICDRGRRIRRWNVRGQHRTTGIVQGIFEQHGDSGRDNISVT
jgi:hypothetical protein